MELPLLRLSLVIITLHLRNHWLHFQQGSLCFTTKETEHACYQRKVLKWSISIGYPQRDINPSIKVILPTRNIQSLLFLEDAPFSILEGLEGMERSTKVQLCRNTCQVGIISCIGLCLLRSGIIVPVAWFHRSGSGEGKGALRFKGPQMSGQNFQTGRVPVERGRLSLTAQPSPGDRAQ